MSFSNTPRSVHSGIQFSKYTNAAALTVFAYDYCLTFSTEVEIVWGTKWEMTRIVFTVARYLPFFTSAASTYNILAGESCGSFITATEVICTGSIAFAEGILLLRTWALWNCSKRVLFSLLFLAGAFIAIAEILSLKVEVVMPGDLTSSYQYYPALCIYGSSRGFTFQYAFLSAYEIVLLSMNSWKKFGMYRDLRSRTLNTLYWDGIMYMSWIIAFSLMNMIVTIAAPLAYVSALSIIFFNLKQCNRQIEEDYSLETMRYRSLITEAGSAAR